MSHERTGPRFSAHIGLDASRHLRGIDQGLPAVFDEDFVGLRGVGAALWKDATGASWSPAPFPQELTGPAAEVARRHDAVSVSRTAEGIELHSGVSGAVPVYVDIRDDSVSASSSIDLLLSTRATIAPDWDGWAQMLAAGGPLGGRTTVAGIRRLRPWERIHVDRDGDITSDSSGWPWLEYETAAGANLDAVGDQLEASVAQLAGGGRLAPLLSGGWDSRILATLASRFAAPGQPLTARTTSSDTGTVMEELVAAKVAEHLGLDHRILMPRRDQLGSDVAQFAAAVDYQTSFHVWFVPVQRDLDAGAGTALDGLGGGIFLGGAFSDPPGGEPVIDRRFGRLTHYLQEGHKVLAPGVIESIRDRTRAGFEQVAEPLADHPFASTFTAYLNRTLPGISLAPYGLLAASTSVATPFLDDRMVAAALQLPPHLHQDGALYPKLLSRFDTHLAQLPTAEQLAPWPRPHPRRIASAEGAQQIRELVLTGPVRELVATELVTADLSHWIRLLSTTRPQHLLRGLAVMALWFSAHEGALGGADVAELAS